ncbi:glucan 1,3-beta-glucosidase [Cladophialophora psammophila CBS 110553]|uniref:Glucan 1,3-beta-glucosidase n=1 Tax=Cladophialophora psammophila CBS 110553 TaxID=1182543 RepID=W9WEW3_9EURO|nr:glucan 1,3-beta-glucosidase [Cladophialophora psammophila CBS 110553]EXJ66657.1 glucan 1,3-beta-glucosidase [Cladophialophora psammophila CBS 110553]
MLFPFLLLLLPWLASAVPRPMIPVEPRQASSSYWLSQIQRQGTVAYSSNSGYKIFRNVKDYGAVGDGVTDDTAAINNAITDGSRCGQGCDSSTTVPAIVYFPPGKYAVSSPVIQLYYTQFVGDAVNVPTILALPSFQGLAVLDTDPYIPGGNGAQWYTNQNNFYRQIRNFVVDISQMPEDQGAGIHWQVAQATSLQNIVFNMRPKSPTNKQQGIFMDNGSGGFMSDLIFNGGNYGAFLGNQQFTTRNMTFNGCNTAIFMNWNWLWTLKSVKINECDIGIDMSNLNNGVNQTVGSVILLDSAMTNTPIGIKTSYNQTSQPATGGTLALQNVDFTGVRTAVVGADGTTPILAGGMIVGSWGQGDTYRPAGGSTSGSQKVKREPQGGAFPPQLPSISYYSTTTTTLTISAIPPPTPPSGVWFTTTTVYVTASPTSIGGASASPIPPSNGSTSSTVSTNATASRVTIPSSAPPGVCSPTPVALQSARVQQPLTAPSMAASLMDGNNVFERSKPQYEDVPVSSFVSVKSAGAKGDGVTDDTAAIQNIFNKATPDQVVYFDHGAYVITDTVMVPSNIRITGEIWPLIMAQGTAFSDINNPKPVFQVGTQGSVGAVEMSDLVFETLGPAPGAIMVQWNVAESSQGSCGMWDVHFRIGGTAGTQLQQDTCQANITGSFEFKPQCAGSFLLMHVTQEASAYLENCWFWVADHELDITTHNQTDIYNGRGLLVESQGPVWLYGTSSEHNQLYNYQFSNARDIFMGAIQTETPYMQATPNALEGGFPPNSAFSDPTFAECTTDSCKKSWGLRIVDSSDIHMYGAGLYSFFDNYLQTCLDTESCQENMVDIQCSSNVSLYGLTTKASVNMVNLDGTPEAVGLDHENLFGQTLLLFET